MQMLGNHLTEMGSLYKSYPQKLYQREIDQWKEESENAEIFKNNILVSFRINGELYRNVRSGRKIHSEVAEILKEVEALLVIINKHA